MSPNALDYRFVEIIARYPTPSIVFLTDRVFVNKELYRREYKRISHYSLLRLEHFIADKKRLIHFAEYPVIWFSVPPKSI